MMTNANDKPVRPVKLTDDEARAIAAALGDAAHRDALEARAEYDKGNKRLGDLLVAAGRRAEALGKVIEAANETGGFRFVPAKSEG